MNNLKIKKIGSNLFINVCLNVICLFWYSYNVISLGTLGFSLQKLMVVITMLEFINFAFEFFEYEWKKIYPNTISFKYENLVKLRILMNFIPIFFIFFYIFCLVSDPLVVRKLLYENINIWILSSIKLTSYTFDLFM